MTKPSLEADLRDEIRVLHEIASELRTDLARLEQSVADGRAKLIPSLEFLDHLISASELGFNVLELDRHQRAARASREKAAEEVNKLAELEREVAKLEKELERSRDQRKTLREVLEAYEASRIWRLTRPLRELRGWGKTSLSSSKEGAGEVDVRRPNSRRRKRLPPEIGSVDVVVCVHNALDETRVCLEALRSRTILDFGLIVVDDGSDELTARYLDEEIRKGGVLVRHEVAQGYTRAANAGVRASRAEAVVLLNSDTVVSTGWLHNLVSTAERTGAGLVGPLSNSATWQSVPQRREKDGSWSTNPLPSGWDVECVARSVRSLGTVQDIPTELLNGFCLLIRKQVFSAIGLFDAESFPRGYGEENDFCFRAADAGFSLRIASGCYVFHEKSRSYGADGRRPLAKQGREMLGEIYGEERIKSASTALAENSELSAIRDEMRKRFSAEPIKQEFAETKELVKGVVFLLPVSGGGGGVHSIVQEALGMWQFGIQARVAVPAAALENYWTNYPSIPSSLFLGFSSPDDLRVKTSRVGWLVGTIFTSIRLVRNLRDRGAGFKVAYYIQDYEPWIVPKQSEYFQEALQSYTLIRDCVLFAKTEWLCSKVAAEHGVRVEKVQPSIDTSVYYPSRRAAGDVVKIAAMVRPSTPRRNAEGTVRVLERIAREYASAEVHFFGCSDTELEDLSTDRFYQNHGVLKREGVADVLRDCQVFVDLSIYQAFGRTAVEAMACGCAVVVPSAGGAPEFGVHNVSALVVDTEDDEQCFHQIERLIEDQELRETLATNGNQKALALTVAKAAESELAVLSRRSEKPCLMPEGKRDSS